AVIVHPPGGIAGGDDLQLDVAVGPAARALLTTPGAGKWYKSNGRAAQQRLNFSIADDALLEWLPQETIVFDAANAQMQTHVALTGNARYAGWEILCFGRRASGEMFTNGSLRQTIRIQRDDILLWNECAVFDASDVLMTSPVGLNSATIAATFIVAATAMDADILARLREVSPHFGVYGVSALPDILVARYLGDSAEQARNYFETLWEILRPWYAQMPAQRPRIWNT